jgi:hypothetical protein
MLGGLRVQGLFAGLHLHPFRWKRFWLLPALFAGLLLAAPASMGSDDQPATEVNSSVKGEDYRLKKKAPVGPGEIPQERFPMAETFPLYGSREEMIFKPWLRAFYYKKNTGFKLNVEYENEIEDKNR